MAKRKTIEFYSGVKVLEVSVSSIDELYREKAIPAPEDSCPNQFIYLKPNDTTEKRGALTKVSKNSLELELIKDQQAFGVKPKNKEQTMALSALLDDDLKLLTLTGLAGSGKTLLALAAALQKIEEKKYSRIIITKPMSYVGNYDLGALPGEVTQKFGPYLENYMSNIQQLVGSKQSIQDLINMYKIEAMPLQLIRGASWINSFVIGDELQVLGRHEILTLGTRIGEGSKLVMMGDFKQRDEDIKIPDTGLYQLINNPIIKSSPLTAHINLIKSERSQIASLVASALED